jgi:hypothetical protein
MVAWLVEFQIFAQVAIIAAINSMTALMSSLLNFFPRFAVNHTLVLHVILEFLFMQSGGSY